ncbi:hypothetical protein L226DRAFT_240846 [Lentinus tigrinus ALCF2SS1-7]|uniref:uncharacterized protein n=1 Tax=Lentinus tigrinus ALCF2SS1-7 TaxID=1328758 RepID=UPI001165F0F3|nr:hypothetical protein L226DRAFT_240846 [Lentinus tigrinus ALCF2SS1-7]
MTCRKRCENASWSKVLDRSRQFRWSSHREGDPGWWPIGGSTGSLVCGGMSTSCACQTHRSTRYDRDHRTSDLVARMY